MKDLLPPVIVVTGPTASGKTALSLALAEKLNAEVVNADSVQVYKDFDIGAAKPCLSLIEKVPHHLFSTWSPERHFDVSLFVQSAHEVIHEIQSRGKKVVVAGGTGLYVRALLCGLAEIAPISEQVKNEIEKFEDGVRKKSANEIDFNIQMHEYLSQLDPVSANKIETSDSQRVKRALLVYLQTGVSISEFHQEHQHATPNYRALVIGLLPPREVLYRRISERVNSMFAQGLVDEVKGLLNRYSRESRPFKSIGYKEVVAFLEGELSEAEMHRQIERDTRRFAKRQLTWWRNQPERLGWQVCPMNAMKDHLSAHPSDIVEQITPAIDLFVNAKAPFSHDEIWWLPLNGLVLN